MLPERILKHHSGTSNTPDHDTKSQDETCHGVIRATDGGTAELGSREAGWEKKEALLPSGRLTPGGQLRRGRQQSTIRRDGGAAEEPGASSNPEPTALTPWSPFLERFPTTGLRNPSSPQRSTSSPSHEARGLTRGCQASGQAGQSRGGGAARGAPCSWVLECHFQLCKSPTGWTSGALPPATCSMSTWGAHSQQLMRLQQRGCLNPTLSLGPELLSSNKCG